MTKIVPETRIPDPIDLDRAEEARLRTAAGLAPVRSQGVDYAGFEQIGLPDRPPQTEREAEVYSKRGRCSSTWDHSTRPRTVSCGSS